MEIYPVPECLDGRSDAGRKHAPGHNLEISGQGPEGAAAGDLAVEGGLAGVVMTGLPGNPMTDASGAYIFPEIDRDG